MAGGESIGSENPPKLPTSASGAALGCSRRDPGAGAGQARVPLGQLSRLLRSLRVSPSRAVRGSGRAGRASQGAATLSRHRVLAGAPTAHGLGETGAAGPATNSQRVFLGCKCTSQAWTGDVPPGLRSPSTPVPLPLSLSSQTGQDFYCLILSNPCSSPSISLSS